MNSLQAELILSLAKTRGIFRAREVASSGASRAALAQLVHDGQIQQISRGLYSLPGRAPSEHDTLAEVTAKSSVGVICLISALRFHDLTTQQSSEIWLAIPHKAHPPKIDYPPLRIVHMSADAITQGVEMASGSGLPVRVFGVAKTIADCFKFRNKIGTDVALEALREAWHAKRINMDELWRYAQICRVANVIRPYLESLGAA